MRALVALAELSFGNGCFFFLPYLALYAFAWVAGIPVRILTGLFVALHAVNLGLFTVYAATQRHRLRLPDLVFWSILLGIFLLPGAYLEYPADPWEHLRRLFQWSATDFVADGPQRHKFAYFWGYTLVKWLPIEGRRVALDFYAAFWQMLVASQVYALSRRLGFDRALSMLQVVGFVLLFGTNVFGMRYYALSSTPLAYAAFLRILVCGIDFLDRGNARAAAAIPPLLTLAWANHEQEVLFSLIGMGSLLGVAWYRALAPTARPAANRRLLGIVLLCLAAGGFARRFAPHLYDHVFWSQVSYVGGFAVWQRHTFLETYGLHGLLSLGLAVWLRRRHPRLAALTLMPTLFLLFPPTALAFAAMIRTGSVSYRILYAFPLSFMLVVGIRDLGIGIARALGRSRERWIGLAAAGLAVLVFAIPASYPWRGRGWFAFHRAPEERELLFLDETARWLQEHRQFGRSCRILGDSATQWALAAHLALRPDGLRDPPRSYAQDTRHVDRLLQLVERYEACGVLVGVHDRLPVMPPSPVAKRSGHFDARLADTRWLTAGSFAYAAEELTRHGWTKTPVPPFYILYEPPDGSPK